MAYKRVENLTKKQTVNFEVSGPDGKPVAQSFTVRWRVPSPSRMKTAVADNELMTDLMFAHLDGLDLAQGADTEMDAATARKAVEGFDDPYLDAALMASFQDASPTVDSFRGKPGRHR